MTDQRFNNRFAVDQFSDDDKTLLMLELDITDETLADSYITMASGIMSAFLTGSPATLTDLGRRFPRPFTRAVVATRDAVEPLVATLQRDSHLAGNLLNNPALLTSAGVGVATAVLVAFGAGEEGPHQDAIVASFDLEPGGPRGRTLEDANMDAFAAAKLIVRSAAHNITCRAEGDVA